MPTIINADTATGGAIITGDTSGQLQLQSGGVTALTATGANVTVAGTFTATGGVTGVNLATGVTGILPVANGGTGATTLTANNVLLGNGTSAVQAVAPGASGNVLTSNGTTWASAAAVSGVQQFTSSGSITAGQAVALNTDGTVSTVTGVNNPEAALGQTTVDGNSASRFTMGSFYDPNNDWTIFARDLPNFGVFQVSAFRVNSSGIVSVFGSNAINYQVAASAGEDIPVRIIRTGTNRYAVMYATSTSFKTLGLFTINATTGAVTSITSTGFSSNYSSVINYDMDYDPVSDRIVVVFRSAQGTVQVEAVNPANGSITATAQFSATGGTTNTIAVACRTTGGQFFLAFGDVFTSGLYFRTATINSAGTTITFVSSPVYAVGTSQIGAMAYAPSIDRYIFISYPSSSQITANMFNTSGAQITGSTITFTSSRAAIPQKSMVNDTLQLVQAIMSNNSSAPSLQYGQMSYTDSAFGAASTSGTFPSSPGFYRGTFSPTGTVGIYTYTVLADNNTNTQAVTFRPFLFSSNAQNFVGFATNTVTTGQNAIVAVPGGVATNRTGLTRNLEYYLNVDGTLVTTPTPFGVVLRATSATGGEVIRPVNARRPVALVTFSNTTTAVIPLGATGFRAIECYYSLSLSSSNNPTVRFTTTSGSTTTLSGTGFWATSGSSSINNGNWSTLSPVSASSFTGFFSVDSSVPGGVNQGTYGGIGWTATSNSMNAPATQISFTFPVTASGSVMVYGIPA